MSQAKYEPKENLTKFDLLIRLLNNKEEAQLKKTLELVAQPETQKLINTYMDLRGGICLKRPCPPLDSLLSTLFIDSDFRSELMNPATFESAIDKFKKHLHSSDIEMLTSMPEFRTFVTEIGKILSEMDGAPV